MQPTQPSPPPPGPGPGQGGPPHSEVNYTAPQFAQDGSPTHHPDYEFIMNPAPPPKRSLLPTGGSTFKRAAMILGGLIILMIIFVIAKSLLGGHSSNTASLISVTQEQQVLIHISAAAAQQQGISTVTLNSSATISTSITSAQQQLVDYMKINGVKVSRAQLALGIRPSVDAQLAAAASGGTYDDAYKTAVLATLTSYEAALKQAYAQTPGPKGRSLLSDQYKGAQLLAQQLGVNPT